MTRAAQGARNTPLPPALSALPAARCGGQRLGAFRALAGGALTC